MKNIITFFENTGVNYSVIWSDCSPYLCAVLLIALILGYYFAKKTNQCLTDYYLLKSTTKVCQLEGKIFDLEAENKALSEKVEKLERKRDEKGHYLPTSGKGHGKRKKQTL